MIRGINSPTNAIQACLALKVLLGLPLRQTTGFMASLLELSGLGWSVPDFSTLSRRQKTLDVTVPYRGSKGALLLLVPSRALLRNTLPGNGQHRHQGGRRRRVAQAQAWRFETARSRGRSDRWRGPLTAQDPSWN